jgi:hypothetical protein
MDNKKTITATLKFGSNKLNSKKYDLTDVGWQMGALSLAASLGLVSELDYKYYSQQARACYEKLKRSN